MEEEEDAFVTTGVASERRVLYNTVHESRAAFNAAATKDTFGCPTIMKELTCCVEEQEHDGDLVQGAHRRGGGGDSQALSAGVGYKTRMAAEVVELDVEVERTASGSNKSMLVIDGVLDRRTSPLSYSNANASRGYVRNTESKSWAPTLSWSS